MSKTFLTYCDYFLEYLLNNMSFNPITKANKRKEDRTMMTYIKVFSLVLAVFGSLSDFPSAITTKSTVVSSVSVDSDNVVLGSLEIVVDVGNVKDLQYFPYKPGSTSSKGALRSEQYPPSTYFI